jgi:sigma-B regulation protein RsbQ
MRLLLTALLALPLFAATVDGIKLHSSSAGHGKETVILVHGWTCDETSWKYTVPALAEKYRVITLDLPGHGQSGSPKDGKFSMELFARAVEAVRSEAKADRVVLVGHSMGTPVIREYARLYPQHVAGLVLVDGLIKINPGGAAPQPSQMSGPDGMKNRENMIKGMFSASTTPAERDHILKMMLAPPESTATGAMLATFDPSSWKDDVMTMPVLGIYADKSRLADEAYSRKIFPHFEFVEVPGTGHFVMIDKPDEFNHLLIAFLDKLKY